MIHTVKGFSIVNKAEVDVFLLLSSFFDDPDVGNLMSGSSAFSKPSLNIWKFSVHVMLKRSLEDFEHNLNSMCRRKWQPIPVFLPGESRRQRSLVGYGPRGHKELDMTEQI